MKNKGEHQKPGRFDCYACVPQGFSPLNFNFNFLAPAGRAHASLTSCLPEMLASCQQLCLWKQGSPSTQSGPLNIIFLSFLENIHFLTFKLISVIIWNINFVKKKRNRLVLKSLFYLNFILMFSFIYSNHNSGFC